MLGAEEPAKGLGHSGPGYGLVYCWRPASPNLSDMPRIRSRRAPRRPLLPAHALLLVALGCSRFGASAAPAPASAERGAEGGAFVAGSVAPGTPLSADRQRWVDSVLTSLTLRQRAAQMVMPWVLGHYTNARDSGFLQIRRWITEDQVGGVVMSLGSPVEVAAKINSMQRMASVPLLVGSDLEPGLGRLEGGLFVPSLMSAGSATLLPNNMAVGATGRVDDALEAGRIVGREARAVGIHIVFAPTVDVNNNPANPVINTRSYGEDPSSVAALSGAFVRGLQEAGVAATAKHFPGHGDTDTDSHLALPVVGADRARLDSVELVPFRASIEAGAAGIMTAHVALPAVESSNIPATLSPGIMTELLRDSLEFEGLTVTDALTMEGIGQGYPIERSAVLAVQAGADILLMPSDVTRAIDAVVAAVGRGELTEERVTQSARRILELKARTDAARSPIVDLETLRAVVGAPEHWAAAEAIASRAVTLLRDRDSLVPLSRDSSLMLITYAPEREVDAGRIFASEVQRAIRRTNAVRVTPSTSAATLDSLLVSATQAQRTVIATYVRRIEGEGRVAIPVHIATWMDSIARGGRTVVVAQGNPYIVSQIPSTGSYMVTYGIGHALERAAARALVGAAPITGHSPITLPGHFKRGDGVTREIVRADTTAAAAQ